MDDFLECLIYLIVLSISIFSNCGMFAFFHKEQSLYFSLLKIISLFEMSFIYSKFLISEDIAKLDIYATIKEKLCIVKDSTIFNLLTFGFFEDFDFSKKNKFFYNSLKWLYMVLNIFLCIETINLIKRPFSQSRTKTKIYYSLSVILIIITYLIQVFLDLDGILIYFNIALYSLFIISGIVSIIFVIIRFCWHKPLIQSAKNFFVMRHFIYIIVLSGMLFNEFDFINYNKFIQNIIIYSLGFVMSLIKISDQLCVRDKKSKKKSKKKGVTSLITSNLNVEFMCCILYGMTDIFIKNQNNSSKKKDISKEQKIHTIKYLNSIDGKIDDLANIKLHVSIQNLGESVNKNDEEYSNLENSNSYFNTTKTTNLDSGDTKGEDALIIEYLPVIFNDLRINDEINDEVMIRAFNPSKNKAAIDKMSESKGKSGSFFFYSHDRKFIIKTISSEEKTTLLDILHDYFNYIKAHNSTLLTKIYGIYTVVIKNASSVNVILMQNLFGCSPIHIQKMFDLKGSSVQRKTKDVQKWKRDQVLKDLDYQWVTKVERKLINFKEEDISEIRSNLINDINFYKSLNLMDYSLLFIIIDYPNNIDPDYNQIIGLLDDPKYKGHVYKSENENYIYIVGIIDYLQKYNFKKKMEHCMKGILYGKEKNMVSAVEPIYYAERFNDFMTKKVFIVGEN